MENKDKEYTEQELIDPALYVVHNNGGSITTSKLIEGLFKLLSPSEKDRQILFGRNDSRFSQKVRNLISHKTLCPEFCDYKIDGKSSTIIINSNGIDRLSNSEYYQYITNEKVINDVIKNAEFQGAESLELEIEEQEFNFKDKSYISLDSVNYSVFELKRKYDKTISDINSGTEVKNGIILNETFQRTGNVWTKKQKSCLIESILMGIPIPFIYLAESQNGNLIVIDGRQRLTALFEYLNNKYSLSNNLNYLKELRGKKAKELVGDLELFRAKIEDASLYIIKIKLFTPESLKLQIFSRVNTSGTQLNAQEIRHALHQGAVTELLEKLSEEINLLPKNRILVCFFS